jgi:hypothetical protein
MHLSWQVLNPLKEITKDIAAERRKHLASGADLHRSLKNQLDTLDRVRKKREAEGGERGREERREKGKREREGGREDRLYN